MKSLLFAAVALLATAFITCTEKADAVGDCISGPMTLPTDSIIGPTTVQAGSKVAFDVTYTFSNNCGSFLSLEKSETGNIITLTVKGQYQGCACADVLVRGRASYAFGAAQPGTYTIQVVQPIGAPKMHTFTVQ